MAKIIDTEEIPESFNQELDKAIENTPESNDDYTPQYRMVGNSKILVSKSEGKLWQTRLKQCKSVMKDVEIHWEKALKYFNINQVGYKNNQDDDDDTLTHKLKNEAKCHENLVYTNIMGTLPNLYSQNPTITITPEIETEENSSIAIILQRLINVILQKRITPGINLQPKARKAIINTLLTNRGIIKIGWTQKSMMNDNVVDDISSISEKLVNAKNINEIKELEGQLDALNEMVDFSEASCCYAQHVLPTDLFIDPTAEEQDGSDAKWMIERTMLPTEWLKAKYSFKQDDENKSVYNPKHVLKINTDTEADLENDSVLDDDIEEAYGYDNHESYKKSVLTECYWVWDKIKRRVYLYADDDWEYPIWVYEDPYKLEEFFPYYILNFNESPNTVLTHGEVSLYVDQQDELNMINEQLHKMREFSFNHYLFNSNAGVSIKDIENWANGGRKIVPVELPNGMKFQDILMPGSIPTDNNMYLFEKGDLFRQVDAASGTDATIRSGEFKTNTTNMAIQEYQAGKTIKLDDKRDLIERWLGNIAWGLAQICLQFMEQEQIVEILGEEIASNWRNYTNIEIKNTFSLQCVGGSTQRPNTQVKQQQALQMIQLLGQFASATPLVLVSALRILARAFDNSVIKQEDILQISQSIEQQLQMQQQAQQAEINKTNSDAESTQAHVQQQQDVPESVQNTIMSALLGNNQVPQQ